MRLLSFWNSGDALYFENSACQSASLRGVFSPVNFQSVMDRPERVSRVTPPSTTCAPAGVRVMSVALRSRGRRSPEADWASSRGRGRTMENTQAAPPASHTPTARCAAGVVTSGCENAAASAAAAEVEYPCRSALRAAPALGPSSAPGVGIWGMWAAFSGDVDGEPQGATSAGIAGRTHGQRSARTWLRMHAAGGEAACARILVYLRYEHNVCVVLHKCMK